MKKRGNLLKGDDRFVDPPTVYDYCRMENITTHEFTKFTKLSEYEMIAMHKENEHLFYLVCIGCRHIKAVSK